MGPVWLGFLESDNVGTHQTKEMDTGNSGVTHGKHLYERLHAPLRHSPLLSTQMLYIFARSHSTLARAVLLDAEPVPTVLFNRDEFAKHLPQQPYRALFEDGDETISVQSAQLPSAFMHALATVTELDSRATHSQVLNDRTIRDSIFAFLGA